MSGSAIQSIGSFVNQELNTDSSPTFEALTLTSGASDGYVFTSDESGHGSWNISTVADVVDDTTPQLGGDLDTNGKNIVLDSTPASDHFSSGLIASAICGETTVFGNVGYIKSDGKMWLSSATSGTKMPVIAMALESGSANDSKNWLFNGFIRDESWDWVVGGVIYAATVSGSLTQTPVSGAGNQAQVVGVALTQDTMMFNPSCVLVEII